MKYLSKSIILIVVVLFLFGCNLLKRECTVHFDSQGGTEIASMQVQKNSTMDLPIPLKDDYLFTGWQLNGKEFFDDSPVKGDITLVATWEKISDVLNYEKMDGQIIINAYSGTSKQLILPNRIDGYPVAIIAENAFENASIVRIKIPNTVSLIDAKAFYNSSKLEHVDFYGEYFGYVNSVITSNYYDELITNNGETCVKSPDPDFPSDVEKWVFSDICPIKKVIGVSEKLVGPDGRLYFSYYVMINNKFTENLQAPLNIVGDALEGTNIKSFEIPNRLQDYDYRFLRTIDSLESITVPQDNTLYTVEDGVLYDKEKKYLLLYPNKKPGSHFRIPDGIAEIFPQAFENATVLKSVEIPNSVYVINSGAFLNASNLERVSFYGEFKGTKRESLMPDLYNEIMEEYAEVCIKSPNPDSPYNVDTTWVFPSGCPITKVLYATKIDNLTYNYYDAILDLAIFDKKPYPILVDNVFDGTKLNSLELPARFKYEYDRNYFVEIRNLQNLTLVEGNLYHSIDSGVLFNLEKSELLYYPSGKLENSYRVPEGVQTIINNAFYGVYNLKTLEIASSVTIIENGALVNLDSLEELIINRPSSMGMTEFVINLSNPNLVIYVPDNSLYDYKDQFKGTSLYFKFKSLSERQ